MRIAIVGAGLAGLTVANQLRSLADIEVFEKSRGPGGRMSTRYAGDYEFDHGAQFFTARTGSFQAFLRPLLDAGVIEEWTPVIAENDGRQLVSAQAEPTVTRYVGAPRMNRIGKALAGDIDVRLGTTVTAAARNDSGWMLTASDEATSGPYDWLILSAPAEQTAAIAADSPDLVTYCAQRPMSGCFALMLGFDVDPDLSWQAARVSNSPVAWIAVNSSKPGRGSTPFTLVIHSSNSWADEHLEEDAEAIREQLLDEASAIAGADLRTSAHCQLHRWRYANAKKQSGSPYFLDEHARLAACGDWCIRGQVEQAFTSASSLSEAITRQLQR